MKDAVANPLVCYRCGASLAALSLPLARLDECPSCLAQLHVCRMCTHYAPRLTSGCDEDDALEVRDKTAANFCDYFKPGAPAYTGAELRAEAEARERLNALFGGTDAAGTPGGGDAGTTRSNPDEARRNAEALFKK